MIINRKSIQIEPCEDDAFCPHQIYHPKYSYTSSHHKLEDRREDCKKDFPEEKRREAPQAGKGKGKREESQRKHTQH